MLRRILYCHIHPVISLIDLLSGEPYNSCLTRQEPELEHLPVKLVPDYKRILLRTTNRRGRLVVVMESHMLPSVSFTKVTAPLLTDSRVTVYRYVVAQCACNSAVVL